MLAYILSAVFFVLFVFLFVLFLIEKSKNRNLFRNFKEESEKISEKLNKLSYGILNQKFQKESSSLPKEITEGFEIIKSSFNKVTADSLSRVCYVGTDAWFEGVACARTISKRLPSGGKIAIVITSSLNALVMNQRYRSFTSTISKDYPDIQILGYHEAHADQASAASYVASIADKVDAIYITGNSAVPGVTNGLALAGRLGDVFVLCHDLDETIATSIANGNVSDTVISLPFGQGHDSVIHLFNSLNTTWKPYQPRLMQTLMTVNNENLHQFWNAQEKEPNKNAFEIEGKVAPMGNRAVKSMKILAFTEDWNSSMCQMVQGIEAAKQELAAFNCEVKICILNQMRNPQSEVFEKAQTIIEEELKSGLDGICAFVGFAEFADLLNMYAKKGISISTFNSEPLSLRSMIEWLTTSSNQLEKFTGEYKKNLEIVSASYSKISTSLTNVSDMSQEQKSSIKKGADSVSEIAGFIDKTAENEILEEKSVQQTTELSHSLKNIADDFAKRINGLKSMGEQVKKSVEKTQAIKQFSENIQSIIGIIDNISEQTNLLAFNAAIESTHAGEYGKGFKVISTEIRGLADQSVRSTKDISKLIDDMRKAVEEGIEANNQMLETVNDQVDEISAAADKLNQISSGILTDVKMVRDAVIQNSTSFQKMKASTNGITSVMENSTKVSEETTGTITEVNNEFNQMNEKITSMTEKLQQLSELVTIMEGSVSSFSS